MAHVRVAGHEQRRSNALHSLSSTEENVMAKGMEKKKETKKKPQKTQKEKRAEKAAKKR
jgi:hypothetical protein